VDNHIQCDFQSEKNKKNNNKQTNKQTLDKRRNEPTNMGLKNQTLLKVCCQGHIPLSLLAASQSRLQTLDPEKFDRDFNGYQSDLSTSN